MRLRERGQVLPLVTVVVVLAGGSASSSGEWGVRPWPGPGR